MKKHNFSAGPCILPSEVLKEASEAIINFNDDNLSLIEISHRSTPFVQVMNEAKQLAKELLSVPDNYSILFLQGGASLEFLMVPFNLLSKNGKCAYINTGTWSKKAITEAEKLGKTKVIADSSDKNYSYIPENIAITEEFDYVHLTSNNTIFGTQFKSFPETDSVLVCDMSSDIFSRKIDISKFGLIYAGAQKNMGPAGTTLVIVKNDILGKTGRDIPTMLDYKTHIDKDSMFNTPPVFPIYVSMLTLRWLKDKGGVEYIEKINEDKSKILYEEIDRNTLFYGIVKKENRSNMNVTFNLHDINLSKEFDILCNENGINGLKGHRSVGGYRASLYNALPKKSVKFLIELMKKFEEKNND
ncbi:3-phosphoserine/phosphohydroxythreonine transaminase [bacterium]|nr:3-phosphoserine/phosphohydroxythreonine transaminase [bacterium]